MNLNPMDRAEQSKWEPDPEHEHPPLPRGSRGANVGKPSARTCPGPLTMILPKQGTRGLTGPKYLLGRPISAVGTRSKAPSSRGLAPCGRAAASDSSAGGRRAGRGAWGTPASDWLAGALSLAGHGGDLRAHRVRCAFRGLGTLAGVARVCVGSGSGEREGNVSRASLWRRRLSGRRYFGFAAHVSLGRLVRSTCARGGEGMVPGPAGRGPRT